MADIPRTVRDSIQVVLGTDREPTGCQCEPSFADQTLLIDASACPFDGQLATSPECRETVIDALTARDIDVVVSESGGVERAYEDDSAALLVAAGRFVEAVEFHDERLARLARSDPLGACLEATGRADVVADIAAETGLAELTARGLGYEEALSSSVGPTLSHWRIERSPPATSTLLRVHQLETGGTIRQYDQPTGLTCYHLEPVEHQLPANALETLESAYCRLAKGEFDGGHRAPARAVRAVLEDSKKSSEATEWTETVAYVLRKHARGYGLLEDFFADPSVSDVFVTAPAHSNRLRATVDGETMVTNVTLTDEGVQALCSRFRRESGRAFSRADPTLDATADISGRRIRIAGVTEPPSTGAAFAFRAQGRDVWTLPALVGNGTLTPSAAAVLSVAVERGGAILVAGPRGAGKTTLLGALLWELPPAVRTVVIEDTPELPVSALQRTGRDIQALLASDDAEELSPTGALRTALRLGNGALVVGEVRGEEASVLYEAMRVGANSEAVLGTIHGDGGEAIYERVVTDLGVSPTSFGVTDLVVSLESTAAGARRVKTVEEVLAGKETTFATLYEQTEAGLRSTGRIERGNSHLLDQLTTPEESYADVRARLTDRTQLLDALAVRDATTGGEVTSSHANRNR